jgi:hypothetical protein
MMRLRFFGGALVALFAVVLVVACFPPRQYDLVIAGGRVIDPETQFDAIAHVGIIDDRIVKISETPLQGEVLIDASGAIVAPGFIDIHSHSPTPLGAYYAVMDGVTTQLDLEAGAFPVSDYGYMLADGAVLNYGASVSHMAIRIKVIEGRDQPYLFSAKGAVMPGDAFTRQATPAEIEAMRGLLEEGLRAGGLGIGLLLDYMTSAVSDAELQMIFEVAAAFNAPIAVHVRRGLPGDPAGLREILALAEATGAPVMICHIGHSAMQAVGDWLAEIDAATARGARIITENLSYAAGGTAIGADVFGRDWRKIFNIDYSDVQWTETGEWLTKERWEYFRKTNPAGMINHHYVKEAWMETAFKWPRMMVSSDVTPSFTRDRLANPNIAGTFGRFLGHYVRERQLMSWPEALARTSLLQAQWLETIAPAFKRKGRLQEGADADIVIFDPEAIRETADYGRPYQESRGISWLVVAGRPLVEKGALVPERFPGQRILAQ